MEQQSKETMASETVFLHDDWLLCSPGAQRLEHVMQFFMEVTSHEIPSPSLTA